MRGPLMARWGGLAAAMLAAWGMCSVAQAQVRPPQGGSLAVPAASASPEERLLEALLADPLTATAPIELVSERQRVVLGGRVGSSTIHAAVVQHAIELGIPVEDRMVIDTAVLPPPPVVVPAIPVWSTQLATWDPVVGVLDPPLASFPPWWGAIDGAAARRWGLGLGLSRRWVRKRRRFRPGRWR